MTTRQDFYVWLQKKHPDIKLVPKQKLWLQFIFDEDEIRAWCWHGYGSGKTFIADLLKEYIADGGKI